MSRHLQHVELAGDLEQYAGEGGLTVQLARVAGDDAKLQVARSRRDTSAQLGQ